MRSLRSIQQLTPRSSNCPNNGDSPLCSSGAVLQPKGGCSMRAVSSLALALLGPALVQEDEAERACQGMEKRLIEAKALRFSFAMTVEVDNHEDKLKGTIWLGEGNKARI